MNRTRAMTIPQRHGKPRACGDEPYIRKWFRVVPIENPAHAGMNLKFCNLSWRRQEKTPRMRG